MSDPLPESSWGETARRIATEFDERLGSPAEEIVTFESSHRAIAVGIALAGSCAQLPIGKLLDDAVGPRSRCRRPGGAPDDGSRVGEEALRELARVHRVIVLGLTRCVNRVYLLRGTGNKLYALHGLGAERMQEELRADMDAIVTRLAAAD